MKLSALLAPLIAAKADHDTIMRFVLAYEAEQGAAVSDAEEKLEASRAKARERFHKWKANHPTNVSKREQTSATRSNALTGGGVRVEDKTSTQKIEPQEQEERKKDPPNGDMVAFRAALSPVLDTDRIEAILKHRRARKAPVTAKAAELFIAAADKAGISVPDAVDACIERGWLTVKADWLAPRGRAGPHIVQKAPQLADVFQLVGRGYADDRERREGSSRVQQAVPHLRPAGTGTD